MRVRIFAAGNHNAGEKGGRSLGTFLKGVPFLCQIQGGADAFILHLGGGDEGLGQQGYAIFSREKGSQAFRVLALPFDGHVCGRIDAVAGKDVIKGIFRSGSFAACVNGLSAEIFDGVDAVAVFHDVQNAECIDGQDFHRALRVVVEDGSQVGRDGCDVNAAFHDHGRDLIYRGGDGEFTRRIFRVHHLDHAHGGRALQRGDPHRFGVCGESAG